VWGTLIYLVFNLIKIGKIGKNTDIEKSLEEKAEIVV
jgi:hypothetical protein